MKTATAKVGGITQNIERERTCFQKYSKVCITRPAVNENLCGDLARVDCKCSTSWAVDNTITHLDTRYLMVK